MDAEVRAQLVAVAAEAIARERMLIPGLNREAVWRNAVFAAEAVIDALQIEYEINQRMARP